MFDFVRAIFASGGFMPHGHCYLWTPGVVWLHVISDGLIALAYFSIPIALARFVRQRRDLDFRWIFVSFAVFILACGTTHVMEIWNVWHGSYWLSGAAKALTAAASIPTAILLTRLIPQAVALPTPATLQRANESLREEIAARRISETALRESHARFRRLLDSNIIGVIFWNIHGDILDANDLLLQMVGYTRKDLRNGDLSWKNLTPPEYAEADQNAVREVQATGICPRYEKEYIRKDGSRIAVMLGSALFEGQQELGISFVLDITELKRAEDALRTLSHRLLQAEDEERRRIAKELHDSTAQDLVAVMMNLGLLQDALDERRTGMGEIIADSLAILENCVNDVRTLSYVVHPPQLDETGLAGALLEYATGFGRRSAIPVRVELPADLERLPEEMELALFRVVQESLANVLRHSKSETATIRLTRMEGQIVLEVIDQGHGLAPAMATQTPGAAGVGITGMRERMQYFGGRLELESSSEGMTVRAVLPLREKAV